MIPVIASAIGGVAALAGALLLVAAGAGHLRQPRRLRAALEAQALLPRRSHRAVAALLGGAELGVGTWVIASFVVLGRGAAPSLLAEAGLYLVILAYASLVRTVRPAAPCGCFSGDGPVSAGVLARAAFFAAASVAGLGPLPDSQPALLAAGTVVVALLAYVLPGALRSPL